MQSIGGNLLQDLGNYANHNGKRERGISTTFLRAGSEDGTQPNCHYNVWANRIGPPLHVEYEGESPADYPGDQSSHSIAGYNYDVREE